MEGTTGKWKATAVWRVSGQKRALENGKGLKSRLWKDELNRWSVCWINMTDESNSRSSIVKRKKIAQEKGKG